MPKELARPSSGRIAVATGGPIRPAVIADAGDYAARRFLEPVTATIRDPHTRRAYTRGGPSDSSGAAGSLSAPSACGSVFSHITALEVGECVS